MKTLIAIAVLLLPLNAFAWLGTVVKVSDGDTIWVKHSASQNTVKVRLFGIDAPEGGQAYGNAATIFLTAFALNRQVSVIDIDMDKYGRNVSIVVINEEGFALQELMLFAGYAWVYPAYCKGCAYWRELEKEARKNKAGLWADVNEPTPPWEWRKNKPDD